MSPLSVSKASCAPTAIDNELRFESISTAEASQEDGREISQSEFFRQIAATRVVVVGEQHDVWRHHLAQLEIACRMMAPTPSVNSDLVIGLEQFQLPAQVYLDEFVEGSISLNQLLHKTEYFTTWGYDFRLYAPIIEWAQQRKVKLLALNTDTEMLELVRSEGLDGLTVLQQQALPFEIEQRSEAWQARLKEIFLQHGSVQADSTEPDAARFQRFLDVQQLWEGTMSATASNWLDNNPNSRMIILAGAGHTVWPETIPDRLRAHGIEKLLNVAIDAVNYQHTDASKRERLIVDYSLSLSSTKLPAAGRMGVALKNDAAGVIVENFAEGSAAEQAGVREGDRLVEINGHTISSYAEVRLQLWQALAGDTVSLRLSRDGKMLAQPIGFTLR